MNKFALILLAVITVSCGVITMDLTTEVSDMGDMTHGFQVKIEGPLVAMYQMDGLEEEMELDMEELPDECEWSLDATAMSISCENLSHAELLEQGEEAFDVRLVQTETEEGTEFRASMPYLFAEDQEAFMADDEFDLGFEVDDLLEVSFSWTVKMPGDIVEDRSNADFYEGGTAHFEAAFPDEQRDVFEVVSIVRPSSGGVCSAPN